MLEIVDPICISTKGMNAQLYKEAIINHSNNSDNYEAFRSLYEMRCIIIKRISKIRGVINWKHNLEQLSESTPECIPEVKGVHLVRLLQIEDDDWLEVVKQRISFHQKLAGIINDICSEYRDVFWAYYDNYIEYRFFTDFTRLVYLHKKLEDHIRKMSEYIIKYEMNNDD